MIAWLASFPRSGNTLCRLVLEQVFGLPTMDEELLDDAGTWKISAAGWESSPSARIGLQPPPELPLRELETACEWRWLKTHAEQVPAGRPAVYVVRDGRDALISYAYFALQIVEGRPREQITRSQFAEMLEGLIRYPRPRYGTWSSNVAHWLDRQRTVVIRYEDLILRPPEVLACALDQLDIPYTVVGRAVPDFDSLQPLFPEFFRSGRSGDWRTEFPPDLLSLFWQHNGETMHRAGYITDAGAEA